MQAVDYFDNMKYSGWMAGGAPLPMNEPAQKARHNMNRMLGDVLVSLNRMNVPHVVNYQPPPTRGGYSQNVDIILNIFSLWEFQIGPDRVFDTVDRAIGSYERECKKLFRKLFNPLYWLGMLVLQFLRIPSKLRGTTGNDVPNTDPSLFGSMRQGWAGWNRTDRLTLIGIIVAVILTAITLMSPEVRRALHLDKTVVAPVESSPAPLVPAPTPTPVQSVPAQNKLVKPKSATTPPTTQKIDINAPGGIPIVGNQGTVDHPTVNNYGPIPRRLSDQTKSDLTDCLRKKIGRFSIGALQGNGEAYKYAEQWRELLLSAGWEIEHKDIPIQIFMIGGGTYSGIRFSVHDASPVKGQMGLAEGSPEQNFRQCITGKSDISGGSMIPYRDFPSGSVRIEVSYQP